MSLRRDRQLHRLVGRRRRTRPTTTQPSATVPRTAAHSNTKKQLTSKMTAALDQSVHGGHRPVRIRSTKGSMRNAAAKSPATGHAGISVPARRPTVRATSAATTSPQRVRPNQRDRPARLPKTLSDPCCSSMAASSGRPANALPFSSGGAAKPAPRFYYDVPAAGLSAATACSAATGAISVPNTEA